MRTKKILKMVTLAVATFTIATSVPMPNILPDFVQVAEAACLGKGSQGEAVKTMQKMLNACGYSCGTVDGIFGNNTDQALRRFQKDHGLVVDGLYGDKSKAALEAAYAQVNNKSSSGILKKGSRGNEVRIMQEMLIACGYSCGSCGADGVFGSGTESALRSFQSQHGLTVDGLYGEKSKAALENAYNNRGISVSVISYRDFSVRESCPTSSDLYYKNENYGGYSGCILGNGPIFTGSVLPNCTGYATGRFNEIAGYGYCKYIKYGPDAKYYISRAREQGLETGSTPRPGAIMCWNNTNGAGHVAIVERVISPTEVYISESGWSGTTFRNDTVKNTDGNWRNGGKWTKSSNYQFQGFIYNPAIDYQESYSAATAVVACAPSATALAVTTAGGIVFPLEFKDVQTVNGSKPYYYDAVYWAATNKITLGVKNPKTGQYDTFDPMGDCKRCQMITFLWRMAGSPEPKQKTSQFKDIKSSDYFYKAVLWGMENNIVSGYSDKTFRPQESCTRQQALTFLWRMAGKPEPSSSKSGFKDVTDPKTYYYKAVLWANESQITTGYSDGSFKPTNTCSRAQMVTFLYRSKDLLD